MEKQERDLMRQARADGHRFIKLRLRDSYKHNSMSPVKVHGVIQVKGVSSGVVQGRQTYRTFLKHDGVLEFKFDELENYFIAYILVDNEPANYEEKGKNLDILVSHLDNPIWEIAEKEDIEFVKERIPSFRKYQARFEAEKIKNSVKKSNLHHQSEKERLDSEEEALLAKLEENRKIKEKLKAKEASILGLSDQPKLKKNVKKTQDLPSELFDKKDVVEV